MPEIAALNAYADTASPNWWGLIRSAGITIAPSGDTIMKSRMMVNCRKARMATSSFCSPENFDFGDGGLSVTVFLEKSRVAEERRADAGQVGLEDRTGFRLRHD